jgi:hypothetical protein
MGGRGVSRDDGLRVLRRDGEKQVLRVTKVDQSGVHARVELIVREDDLEHLLTPLEEANQWGNEGVNLDELEEEYYNVSKKLDELSTENQRIRAIANENPYLPADWDNCHDPNCEAGRKVPKEAN